MKLFGRKAMPKYLAICEYWVYLPNPSLPPQAAVMTAMLQGLSRKAEAIPPLEAAQALLFSDIRLHTALVLRTKNPHLFRPDLFESHIEPTPDILRLLGEAKGLAKVRYLSEDLLEDDRHLQFLPRLASTIADMAAGTVIFDCVAERLFTSEQFRSDILRCTDTATCDFHTRVVWMPNDVGGRAATRGLAKIGLPELTTPDTRGDHQSLVCEVMDAAVGELWKAGKVLDSLSLTCYDDKFLVKIEPGKRAPLTTRILRVPNP